VLLDSGANINACHRKLAELLDVSIQKWKVPFRVLFGNNTEVWSEEFIDLGGLMGRTAIIKNCTHTILSVSRANKRGYSVDMRGGTMRCVVTDQHGKIVVDAPIDETSGLYFIDIGYFMQRGDVNATINARRRPITKKIKAAVKELHECLHHAASPAVMARALRFGAWPNMEMLPTDVERVYTHQDCLACMLGKSNRLPRAFSAETSESSFGEVVSLDYKSVNPVSASGHKGFYLFAERSSRFLFVVLTRSHDSVNELCAIRMYRAYLMKHGHILKTVIVDAGVVEKDQELLIQLGELGIHR
jgi:hypothetical protein